MDNDIIDGFLVPNNPSGRLRTRWLKDGRIIEFHSVSNTLGVSHKLTLDGQKPPDGQYTLNDGITRFEVLNGLVVHEYYIERFRLMDVEVLVDHGNYIERLRLKEVDIFVDCSRVSGFKTGCKIYTNQGQLTDGIYKLKIFKWVKVVDERIVRTSIFRMTD